MKPALLLLPNLLADHRHHEPFLPASVERAVESLDGLICESEKAGRRFLSRFKTKKPTSEIPITVYNKNTPDSDIDFCLEPIQNGERWGFITDAGLPCLADPGAKVVARARQLGLLVQAFVGPSSISLGLMLSGLNSQSFAFHGYLPKDSDSLKMKLQNLEQDSKAQRMIQIFIERPYSNDRTLEILLETLSDSTQLCVAAELTSPEQMVVTQKVSQWKKITLPNLNKKNALFLFLYE